MSVLKFIGAVVGPTSVSSSRSAISIARHHFILSSQPPITILNTTRLIHPETENTAESSSSAPSTGTNFSPLNHPRQHPLRLQSSSSSRHCSAHSLNNHLFSSFASSPLLQRQSHHDTRRTRFNKPFNVSRCIHTSSTRQGPDPYTVLGVSREASSQDIKKRYRELAKQYHPDLNSGADASTKMAAISSAYQVLSDPKQKQFYDQTGVSAEEAGVNPDEAHANPFGGGFGGTDPSFMFTDFTNFFTDAFGGRAGGHVHKGEDIATEVTLEFLEAAKGCRKAVHLHANSSCNECSGTGCSPGTSMSTCRGCSGTGTQKIERGPIIFGTVCSRCGGSGQIVAHPCKSCKGTGTRSQPRAVDLDFPAGIRSGMELRISGQGHAGARGGRSGDLFVKVDVRLHHQFKLVQNDVHVTVPLTLKQCLLGGEVFVPTLDGQLKLSVAPGTAPGEIKLLRGKGIKKIQERGYGDIAVHWSFEMPRTLTERQKEIVEEFDNIQFGRSEQQQTKDGSNSRTNSESPSASTKSSSTTGNVSSPSSSGSSSSSSSRTSVNGKSYGNSSHVPPPPRPPTSRRSTASDSSDGASSADGSKEESKKGNNESHGYQNDPCSRVNVSRNGSETLRKDEKVKDHQRSENRRQQQQQPPSSELHQSSPDDAPSAAATNKSTIKNEQSRPSGTRNGNHKNNTDSSSNNFSPKSWFNKKFGKMKT